MVTAFLCNARRVFETIRGAKPLLKTCDSASMLQRNFSRLFADLCNLLTHSEVAWAELTRPGHSFLKELLQLLATVNMVDPQTRRFGVERNGHG